MYDTRLWRNRRTAIDQEPLSRLRSRKAVLSREAPDKTATQPPEARNFGEHAPRLPSASTRRVGGPRFGSRPAPGLCSPDNEQSPGPPRQSSRSGGAPNCSTHTPPLSRARRAAFCQNPCKCPDNGETSPHTSWTGTTSYHEDD